MQNQAMKSYGTTNYKSLSYPEKTSNAHTPNSGAATAAQGTEVETLQTWIPKAEAWLNWYQGIVSGTLKLEPGEKAPTRGDYAQVQEQYIWALNQNVGSNWDPMSGGNVGQGSAQGLPAGAKLGPMGSVVFNSEKAETTYSASAQPVDVLSDEFSLDIDVKVKDVTVEKTKDERLQPAMDVIKITVKDPYSVPSETVYFVQPDAKIKINTIGGKGVSQKGTEALKLADGSAQITIGSFQAGTTGTGGTATAESSLPGVEDSKTSGVFTYKPEFEGEKIDFFSQPGKNQTHHVWSNANISTKPGDKADVSLDPNIDIVTGKGSGDMIVKVTHDDGSTDTYLIKKGYSASVNINKEYITFNNMASADGKIPAEFGDRLKVPTLGAAAGTAASQSPGKVETGKGAEADAKVQAFINAFTNPKVSFEDVKKAGLIEELAYSKNKPSGALLKFILDHDSDLQYQKAGHNSAGMIQRVGHFLEGLGYKIGTSIPEGYHQRGDVVKSLAIVINGVPYALLTEGWGNPDPINLNPISHDD